MTIAQKEEIIEKGESKELFIKTNIIEKEKEKLIPTTVISTKKPDVFDLRKENIKSKKKFKWLKKFLNEKGEEVKEYINMRDMSPEYLQNIAYKVQHKIDDLQLLIDRYSDLMEQIDIVAEEKNIPIKDVDKKKIYK